MNKCKECGRETINLHFCSRSCSASYNNRGVRRHGSKSNCKFCGEEIPSQRTYCDLRCQAKHRVKIRNDHISLTENDDGKYGHRVMKEFLIEKFGNVCQMCGNKEWNGNQIPLEIHHIDGKSKNNTLKNLMIVCPNCHTFTDNYKSKNPNSDREYFKFNQRR